MEMVVAMEVGTTMLGIMQRQRKDFSQTQNILTNQLTRPVKSQVQQDFTKTQEWLKFKQLLLLLNKHFKRDLWELQSLQEIGFRTIQAES